MYTGLDGKNPIIVYDGTTSGLTSTTIENSLFQGNQGSLLGFQAGSATLKLTMRIEDDNGYHWRAISGSINQVGWSFVEGLIFVDVTGTLIGVQFYAEGPAVGVEFWADDFSVALA